MPAPADTFSPEEIRAYTEQVQAAANRSRSRERITPQLYLENSAAAFMSWVIRYFPHKVKEWEDWQEEPVRLIIEEPRALVMVPAGTMKTTVGAELKPLYRICQNPNYEQLGIFKNDEENKKSLRAIKLEMLQNEDLIRDYGPFYGRGCKWNEHMINVAKRTRRSKQPNLYFIPYGGMALGNRFHNGFVDDCVTREMAASPEQTRKFMNWLAVDFENGPYPPDSEVDWEPGMMDQITVYGTRMTRDDGYAKIEERNQAGDPENPHFRPYIVCAIDIIKDEAAQETISKRWPWAKLMAKKDELQEPAFSMRMRNKVGVAETQVFKEAWVRGGSLGGVEYPGNRDQDLTYHHCKPGDRIAIGYDPQSGSTTRWAKYAALVALGVTPDPDGAWRPWLFDWWKGQVPALDTKDPKSQISRIMAMAKAANLAGVAPMVVLEDNNVQAAFKDPILTRAQELGIQLSVEPTKTGANKADAESGIETSARDFQNGWMRLPWALPADEEQTVLFEAEMIAYNTSKYSDVPMAWWFARNWLYANRFAPKSVTLVSQPRLPRYMQRRYAQQGRFMRVTSAHALPLEVDHGA